MQKIISLLFFCVVVGCGSSNPPTPPNPYLVFEGEYIIDCHWEHVTYYDDPDTGCDFCVPIETNFDFGDTVTITIIEDNIAVMVGTELNYQIIIELSGYFTTDFICDVGPGSISGRLLPAEQMYYEEKCQHAYFRNKSTLTCIPG